MYILKLHNFMCQLYVNKAKKNHLDAYKNNYLNLVNPILESDIQNGQSRFIVSITIEPVRLAPGKEGEQERKSVLVQGVLYKNS